MAIQIRGTSFLNELHISQDQLDMLDLSFFEEDIPIAYGLFHLTSKDELFAEECHTSDNDSTVDLTDSSHSSHSDGIGVSIVDDDNQSSHFRPSVLESDIHNISDEDDSNNFGKNQQQATSSRPRLAISLRNSFRRSFKSFKNKETDETKKQIKAAALRFKIRQQKYRNMLLAEELAQSKERERDLQVAIHQQKTTSASDEYQKCIIEAVDEADERGRVKVFIDRMKAEKRAIDGKRERFAEEAAETRRILDSNAERLEFLRHERNEQATQRLNPELFFPLVRAGAPDEAEHLLAPEKVLRIEVNGLRAKIELSSSEGEQDQKTTEIKQSQGVEVLQMFSEKTIELQNDRYELVLNIGNVRHLLGQLKATKAKQGTKIEALEEDFLALTADELHTLDVVAEQSAAKTNLLRRRPVGGLFGRR